MILFLIILYFLGGMQSSLPSKMASSPTIKQGHIANYKLPHFFRLCMDHKCRS